ncbi:MAG: PAS domain S-box protein [Crocinitomicaceae bacterium]|nr:PAS domain S-box protein [Crocinitomicaceae bacterium]
MGIPLRIFGAHIKVTALILKEMMNQNITTSFEQIHEAAPISLALNSNNTEIVKGSDELIHNFNNSSNVQEEIILEDGTKYPIEMVGILFYDKDDRPKIGSYIEDVSERVQLTKQLQRRDELLGLLAQNTSDTLMIFNNKNEITYASPSFERITGKKIEKFPVNEMEAIDYVHPDELKCVVKSYRNAVDNKERELVLVHRAIHVTEGDIWLEDRANMEYDSNGNHVKTFVVSRNITKRKNLEIALLEESQKRKEIAEQLVEEKEKSKEELYKDLHDGVNQLLFASRLHLENSGFANDENVSQAVDYLSKAIIEIRKIAIESTSQFIVDSSFDVAITEYLVKLNVHSDIKFSVDNLIEEHLKLDDNKKKHLFRICQELSQNAIKHSNATKMSFRFRIENNELILIAKDNGNGLNENQDPGIGMKNIIDRVYLMEGKIRFINFKNNGLAAYIRVKI